MPPVMRTGRMLLSLAFLLLLQSAAVAAAPPPDDATVRGFVTAHASGQALAAVNVTLHDLSGDLARGATTDSDGLYVISGVKPGRYVLRASFVGYLPFGDTLRLASGKVRTVNVALRQGAVDLEEIEVEAGQAGIADVTAGAQTIQAKDLKLVPTPGVSGNLGAYLTTLPGVVSLGDRGGQLYIRGGEPSQNLLYLDGIPLYQPLHLLSFYSTFPSEVLKEASVYAGGYGAEFGGRLSAIIDAETRNGNKERFTGAATLSPFLSGARVEGPLGTDRVSLLASVRQSVLDEGAEQVVNQPLPFSFGDAFAKVHANVTRNSRLSVMGLSSWDRGRLGQGTARAPAEQISWQSRALGGRYLFLPRSLPLLAEVHVSYSRLESTLGLMGPPSRSSTIRNLHVALEATYFGDRANFNAGLLINEIKVASQLGGLYQNVNLQGFSFGNPAIYVEPEFEMGGGLRIRPGLRGQLYVNHADPLLEPRLRVVWERGPHQVSGAVGLYHQDVIGLSDRRDAASVFTAWTKVPTPKPLLLPLPSSRFDNRLPPGDTPSARHALLGYQVRPTAWLTLSVEGFYKDISNLFIAEWTAIPRFTTRLQPAQGRALGGEVRLEVRRPWGSGFITYGLSSTRYEAQQASLIEQIGKTTLRFRPPHDRRHQVNVVANTSVYGIDLSARWAFSSGRPFSRVRVFDGFVLIDDLERASEIQGRRRVVYEYPPYNGVLPTYHRLDVSASHTFSWDWADLTVQGSLINAYNRRNIFYLDTFTNQRKDQLPLVPSLGLEVGF